MDKKEFVEKYCRNCGSQRCEGIDSEWINGCKFRWNLEGYDPASEIAKLEKQVMELSSRIVQITSNTNDDLIFKIINKVREIGKYNPDIKDIICNKGHVTLTENNQTLKVDSIEFFNYDKVIVTNKGIYFHSEYGKTKTILEYNGWDKLLSM